MSTIELEKVEKANDDDAPLMRHIVLNEGGVWITIPICGARLPIGSREEFFSDLGPVSAVDCVVCAEIARDKGWSV